MACDFSVSKLEGVDQILLVHQLQDGTDTGFGAAKGTSSVRLTGGTYNDWLDNIIVWSPTLVLAALPAGLIDDRYTVSLTVVPAVGAPCPATAVFQLSGGSLDFEPDLIFATASPAVADLGATVEIINVKPDFTWREAVHGPIDLIRLDDTVSDVRPRVLSGWGTNRLSVRLPAAGEYNLQSQLESHEFRFDDQSTRVPIVLRTANLDPVTLTIVFPSVVPAGDKLRLLCPMPGFVWSQGQHSPVRLRDRDHTDVADLQVVSGWGSQELVLQLPAANQFPPSQSNATNSAATITVPAFIKFATSNHEVPFVVEKAPSVRILMIEKLVCRQPEDRKTDEIRLELRLGPTNDWFQFNAVSMSEDEEHYYTFPFTYVEPTEARLMEEDPDPDDNLGTHTLTPDETRVRFTGDDADYWLYYSIIEVV